MPDSIPSALRRLPRAIATVCLSGTLPEKLEAAAAAGFDGVEIFEQDLLNFDGTPAEVRRLCDDLGLGIPIYQPFRDFEAMPEPQRGRNLDRAERKFDVMEQLGTDLVLVCSNVQATAVDDDSRAAADLRAMAERAAARGMRIGYEALAWGRHVRTWGHAWRIVQAGDHPALGLIVDSFHTLSLDDDPSGIADVPGERIFFVQLADAPRLKMDVLGWSRHYRNFPGQGGLPVTGFVRAVLASGYRGPLSLEIFNDDFRSAPARPTARDGLRSLVLAEAEAGVPGLPEAPKLGGTEFLEFAVDDAAGEDLAEFLGGLGFHRAGLHRSKAVELWRQDGADGEAGGSVNLVVNREQDSAASEHFQMHGPSVCAIAFRVDDAVRTTARAAALLCPEWQERTGAGEKRIPAVRAPDGTLVYLVDPAPQPGQDNWHTDFDLAPDPARPGPGNLVGVDHVAQALPAGRMDAFVLFYRAVFGLEPSDLLDIPDPYGLVQSRAMVSPGGEVRMPLNISEGRETATGRFVSAYAGAGIHHIAFATRDAAATVRACMGRGLPMLHIPGNYYDDLQARLGLDDAHIEALRELNLLYDRDEGGEFVHAYTTTFADRFFFEIAERRGAYRGFGAPNAPARMAAQAAQRRAASLGARTGFM